jgi:enoyl-CoA hydratase/carnithine racemase
VIGGPNAKFRFPEVAIGHVATGGITLRLVQMVDLLRAKELLLCWRMVDAEEALKIGLLTETADDPKERAMKLAFQMAKIPAVSSSTSKLSLERVVFLNLENVLQDEINIASCCFSQADAVKAFSDFAKRKQPVDVPVTEIKDLNQSLS